MYIIHISALKQAIVVGTPTKHVPRIASWTGGSKLLQETPTRCCLQRPLVVVATVSKVM